MSTVDDYIHAKGHNVQDKSRVLYTKSAGGFDYLGGYIESTIGHTSKTQKTAFLNEF